MVQSRLAGEAARVWISATSQRGRAAGDRTPRPAVGQKADDAHACVRPRSRDERTAMSRKKILLVDDSNTVLMMEKMVLTSNGYDIVVAHDGAEGVDKAVSEQPDLILLDLIMPKMDGIEACRLLRARPSTSAIPIIMVTTRTEEAIVENSYRNGCNDYVNKPINSAELLAKVRSLLEP
jgi:CheY-like chemotaxis protein